jgi:hypothetical protein
MNPETIVRCGQRDWVLLPSEEAEVYTLRPLAGTSDEEEKNESVYEAHS